MKKTFLLSIFFCFLFSFTAHAKDMWEMANSPVYKEKAPAMLGRGLFNAVTCFVDIPVQTVNGAKEGRPEFIGAVGGFGKGAVCTVLRAASGVIDVATFWIPGFNGLPVSRSYDNCLAYGAQRVAPTYVAQPSTYQAAAPVPQQESAPAESRMQYVKK